MPTPTTPGLERKKAGEYADIPGFCKSVSLEEIQKHGHVLTPGRYVGVEAQDDDGEPFEDKMTRLVSTVERTTGQSRKTGRRHRYQPKGARIWRMSGDLETTLRKSLLLFANGTDRALLLKLQLLCPKGIQLLAVNT